MVNLIYRTIIFTNKNNIKIKNMKQIKNKRLNSDDIDDLNFSDNKSGLGMSMGGSNEGLTKKMSKPNLKSMDVNEPIDEIGMSNDKSNFKDQSLEITPKLKKVEKFRSQKVINKEESYPNVPLKVQSVKNRNLSSVNSVLKENLLSQKIIITNSNKIPSFNVHNNKISNNYNYSDSKSKTTKVNDDYRSLEEESKDKIEISNSFIVKTNIPSNSKIIIIEF